MNAIKVISTVFDKIIEVPTSKSYATRLLILASLSKKKVSIRGVPQSTDVVHLLNCLRSIGIEFIERSDGLEIINSFPDCEDLSSDASIFLTSGDGGTTNRFLLALLGLGKKKYKLMPEAQFLTRPKEALVDQLRALGAEVKVASSEIIIQGPITLENQEIEVDASETTQFASAFQMLAATQKSFTVTPINMRSSSKYFELTKYLLDEIGLRDHFVVPVDFSSASYPIALAITNGKVEITNCTSIDRYQADAVLLELIEKMGGDYHISEHGLRIEKCSNLAGISHDCSECLDLVPALIYILAQAKSSSQLSGLEALKYKESDRISEMLKILKLFSVNYRYDGQNDSLEILPGVPHAGEVDFVSPQDHRMAMMAYLFMRISEGGTISNFKCVEKSFPNFYEVMK